MADTVQQPTDVTNSNGWFIRQYDEGQNDPVCPQCFSTVSYEGNGDNPCPNGCQIEVCADYLCPYCVYGDDPFCEDK